ncbi:hypothetical protein NPX13_g7781 [Xylaria arbuscula]|uniref:Uncharacterized protein n=1 Tax=Xylaria arbuscula TaxID=114810 RepID=A0A9W8NA06_9PEZI|nr:hypothetical protein NPX13_g7781 [Xylaria arbuscula]
MAVVKHDDRRYGTLVCRQRKGCEMVSLSTELRLQWNAHIAISARTAQRTGTSEAKEEFETKQKVQRGPSLGLTRLSILSACARRAILGPTLFTLGTYFVYELPLADFEARKPPALLGARPE